MNKRDKEIHETIKTIGTFNQRSVNMILFSMLLGLLEDKSKTAVNKLMEKING